MLNLQPLIDKAKEQSEAGKPRERFHLGCSEAGEQCQRYVWLKFRWAIDEAKAFKPRKAHLLWGQMLRLFRRGHQEEKFIIEDLKSIGCKVSREQEKVTVIGHLQGSIDGVVSNVPELKGEGLLEAKTHSLKSFTELQKKGIKYSKPVHYAQMQLYMGKLKLPWALYCAVCKDNDTYHFEAVEFSPEEFFFLKMRAHHTSLEQKLPRELGGPTWWQCKMCSAYSTCHEQAPVKEINCRTCKYSEPIDTGAWVCNKTDTILTNEEQTKSHDCHEMHDGLVQLRRKE